MKKLSQKLLKKVATNKVLKENSKALKSYSFYKEANDIIDRTSAALGRKTAIKLSTSSTINFEIKNHAVASTTA